MKQRILLAVTLICCNTVFAQRTIKLNNLWAKPEVHVLFQGYTLSFTIKDVNKAVALLAETGDSSFGTSTQLDTSRSYDSELFPGVRTQYRYWLQPLIQNGVGSFLLLAGHAEIANPRHRKLSTIIADIQPVERDDSFARVNFYDPRNNHLLFSGRMNVDLYNRDLGID